MSSPVQPQRVLPHDEQAERAVLAGLMLDNDQIKLIAGILEAKDFYGEGHSLIYGACLRLAERGSPVDYLTLRSDLENLGVLERAGGISYISNMDLDLPDVGRIESYAKIVKDRSSKRQLIELSGRSIKLALDSGEPALEILARTEREVRLLASGAEFPSLMAVGETLRATVAAVEDRHDSGAKELYGLPTGLRDLDRATEGLVPGELIYIAGRPGMGKSSLALAIAKHSAVTLKRASAYFSLEMGRDELNLRLLAHHADVPFTQLRRAVLSSNQWARVHAAEKALSTAPLFLSTKPRVNISQFCSAVRRQNVDTPLAVVVVDYLQLLVAESDKRREKIEAASRELKLLSMELELPVIAVSQLSRETERRSDGRPKLSDLREAGGLEQDADMVIFTYRESEYAPDDPSLNGAATLIIAKHRNGETHDVDVAWIGPTMAFRNLDRGEAPW